MVSILKLVSVAKDEGLDISFYPIFADAEIARARNAAVAHFLKDQDNTHLLFLDADLIFEPKDVFKLIEADKDVISGSYPKKYIVWDRLKENINEEPVDFSAGGEIKVTKDNFLEVEYVPQGFLLIKREVILKLINHHPELHYQNYMDNYGDNNYFYDLFKVGVNNEGFYESGNWHFCSLWKRLGGQLLIHPEVNAKHLGWYEYSGNFMNYLINLKK
jgi:hypothetical protein